MRKKVLPITLQLFLLFGMAANAEIITGSCGDNARYTLDTETGILEIFGSGEMRNYDYIARPWYNKCDINKVIISYGITSVGYNAFTGYRNLISATIPSSVTSIGNNAFDGCISLKSITIPSSVTNIEHEAFRNCSSLTSITIPYSVSNIGYNAFEGCYILKSNFINESNAYIDDCGLTLCDEETNEGLLIANNVLVKAHNDIKKATIPSSVTSIGDRAFGYCRNLISITIPSSVTSIGYGAFEYCSNLTSIAIPSYVANIGDGAFEGCSSLTSITIPSSVTSIGYGAFEYCSSLTSVYIPSSVTSIDFSAFRGCVGLTAINIPSSVTSIGEMAFFNCSSLTSITIPSSVTCIGNVAFEACNSLESVIVESSIPANIEIYAFGSIYDKTILYVPAGSENAYREAPGWSDFVNILTYDPSKTTYTLKIKHSNLGDTEHEILSGEKFSLKINMENVQKVSFNGKDVTANMVNGKYITPEITSNSELVIDYRSMPTGNDIDGDGSFTISDITELIKRYLNTGE